MSDTAYRHHLTTSKEKKRESTNEISGGHGHRPLRHRPDGIGRPQPEYPAIAKQLKLEGAVSLTAYVTEEGTVEKVEKVSGNPILLRSAGDALMRWKEA